MSETELETMELETYRQNTLDVDDQLSSCSILEVMLETTVLSLILPITLALAQYFSN